MDDQTERAQISKRVVNLVPRIGQRDDMRADYKFDYSTGVRGQYYRALIKGNANVVVLEPDVAKAFRTSAAVNEALRSLLELSATTRRLTTRSSGRPRASRAVRSQGA